MKSSASLLKSWLVLGGLIAITFAAAGIGGYATASSVQTWYPTLAKPGWNPPAAVFGPVWTTLYLMMAVAAWRVWRLAPAPGRRGVLTVYFGQLALNALWSVLFFGLRSPALALADIAVLLACLAWVQIRLLRLDRAAACLWLPYVLWVGFASVLNFTVWRLN